MDLQPHIGHYTYEEILLFIRKVIRAVTPKIIYERLAPIYRNRFRKNVLNYRKEVALGKPTDNIKFVGEQEGDTHAATAAYDLIHVPLPQNFGHVTAHAKRLLFTVHDLSHRLFPQFHQEQNIKMAEAGMKFIQEKKASVIAISTSTQFDLEKYYSISSAQVPVIYEAVDRNKFRWNVNNHFATEVRTKYEIFDREYFLTVSTLEPRKNLETLIKSFNDLCEQLPEKDFVLVIVGNKGWKYDSIFKHQSKFASRILFTGFVPDNKLAALYSDAVCFSYVSHYEGFGLPILEAMSCRVPVIVANNSSMPELVGDSAVLVETKDSTAITKAMKEVLLDKNYRERKAIEAWRRSFDFSWRKTAIETIKAYEAVIVAK